MLGGAAAAEPSGLAGQYAALEARLVALGALRTDRGSARTDAASLTRDFTEAALNREYGAGLTAGAGLRTEKPLTRWEEPVRIGLAFGASVPEARRAADRKAVAGYAARLARVTGHPIALAGTEQPNFHVLVVSEAERAALARQLPRLVPGASDWMVRTVAAMRSNHLCMVVAEPHPDRRRGYVRAVAILRAEHVGRLRQACLEEEIAQGLGLSNDCSAAEPSIFNDNQHYALLTRRDELMLKMLYDPSLASGMTPVQALPRITALAERLARP